MNHKRVQKPSEGDIYAHHQKVCSLYIREMDARTCGCTEIKWYVIKGGVAIPLFDCNLVDGVWIDTPTRQPHKNDLDAITRTTLKEYINMCGENKEIQPPESSEAF